MNPSTPCHSVSAAAAIVDENHRVLVIRRRDNHRWEPPGGVLELDEPIHAGLVREVREETGLTVEPGPLTGVYKNLERGVVALVFRCAAPRGTAAPTTEASDVRWLDREQISEHLDEAYAVRLLDALDGGAPAVRVHDGVEVVADHTGRPI